MSAPEEEPRFERLGELGRGGMATVWLARDRHSGEQVALKVLHPHLADRPSMRRRLARELHLTQALTHPAVLLPRELVEEGGELALVLPVCRGEPLQARVEREGPVAESLLRQLLHELGGALIEAHRLGVLHRDLTPGNVLLGQVEGGPERPWLVDFGLARLAEGAASTAALGTVGYAAPELWLGQADPRTDAFGLGATLYFAATGEAPYAGPPAGPVPDLAARRPDLDLPLVEQICALLAPERSARANLPDILAGTLTPPTAPVRERWQLTQVGAALSLIGLLAVGWFQDVGSFLLSTLIDGHAVPNPDVFEMSQGVAALLLLPLALLPALLGAGLGWGQAKRRLAPWIGLVVLALANLLYAFLAAVVMPGVGMTSTADMFGTMLFHLGAFNVLGVVVVLGVRPWRDLRGTSGAPEASRQAEPMAPAEAAVRGLLKAIERSPLPQLAQHDLKQQAQRLLEDCQRLEGELLELRGARQSLGHQPAKLASVQARRTRAQTLDPQADLRALDTLIHAEEQVREEDEALERKLNHRLAQLMEIRAAAARVRRDLVRGPEGLTESLDQLRRRGRQAKAAMGEIQG